VRGAGERGDILATTENDMPDPLQTARQAKETAALLREARAAPGWLAPAYDPCRTRWPMSLSHGIAALAQLVVPPGRSGRYPRNRSAAPLTAAQPGREEGIPTR
jgi:hypothetical protein